MVITFGCRRRLFVINTNQRLNTVIHRQRRAETVLGQARELKDRISGMMYFHNTFETGKGFLPCLNIKLYEISDSGRTCEHASYSPGLRSLLY